MKLKFYIVVFLLVNTYSLAAQLNATTTGDAFSQGDNCFVITADVLGQKGGVWYDNPIDFDTDFIIYYQNNFGNKDANGADGMALVFKGNPTPVIGVVGGGLGYEGITPSLVIEFDTYQNFVNNDPPEDHISIMRNADPRHNNTSTNIAGPVQASASSANIEDGSTHEVKIEWDATAQMLGVFFDCQLRLTLNLDVKSNIFSGDDTVFFGFVGSTGGLSNLHQVCFNRISFVDNLQLQDATICSGGSVVMDATIPSGDVYSWSPTQGVSNPNIPNPTLTPSATTTYTVAVSDFCGDITTEEVIITLQPPIDPTFDAVSPICLGESSAALPSISNNGISGVWSPALDNTQTTTYTFSPSANQCANTITLEIVVTPIVTPVFDAVAPICSGETLTALPTTSNNGIIGSWSPALDNTQTTTYTFDNQCASIVTLEIIVNPIIIPQFDSVDSICPGESLATLPTISNNGISGIWSPALDNTQTTTYTFTPDTGQTCAQQITLEIVVNPILTAVFNAVAPICSGETLTALPTISNNGISGIWSPALDNTQTTTYTFTPDTGQTCAQQRTLEIVVNPILTAVFDAVRPICEGDVLNSSSLPQVSNNGIIGTWSPVLNNSQTTIYTFTPAASECATITTLEILVSPRETPIFDTIEPICSGDFLADLQAESNNGITGVWSPALNNTATTVYTFSPNIGVCATTATLEVIVNPIESPIFDTIDPICSGETLIVLPTISNNGITGVWSPALDNTQTTTYTFVPSANQCADTITLEIVVNPILTAVFDAVAPICSGETLTALPTKSNNGITGSWSPALDNTQTTIYTFAPLGSQCANLVTLEIIVNPIIIPLFDSVDLICNDESLAALPTISNNGISGIWSPVLDNTQTTTYTFTPDVGQGCLVEVTLEIVVDIPITPTFSIANSICEGDDLEDLPMISNEGIVGVWTPQLNNLATTTYTFIPDTGQCAEEVSQEIVVISISELSVTVEVASQSFNDNQIVVASVTGGTGLYEYQLDYGPWKESNIFRGIRGCEDHIIRVREIAGCSNIAIEAFQILDYPKYFTPNGDANNDRWNIKCLEDQGGARITIFNRYGKLLAVINPSSSGWDGIYNNAIMPTADYWFKAEYFDENGSPIVFASHFTLKR